MTTLTHFTIPAWLRPLCAVVAIILLGLAVLTEMNQPLFGLPQPVATSPWLWYSVLDFYAVTTLFWVWLCGKESSVASRVVWWVLLVILGSMAAWGYLWWLLRRYPAGTPLKNVIAWGER